MGLPARPGGESAQQPYSVVYQAAGWLTELAAGAWPRANQVTSRDDRIAMLPMVVLAQEDRPRICDHFHLCLRDAASVTRNPQIHAHAGSVVLHHPGDAPRPGEVVPEDSHRHSLQKLMSDPFLNAAGQVR
jgi:hypothetical protein